MGAVKLSSCVTPNPHRNMSLINSSSERRSITFIDNRRIERGKLVQGVKVVNDAVSTLVTIEPSEAQLTWQIIAGSLAGVVPFVVAGIEFSKRIAEQRRCSVCNGSGLVLRDKKYYFRCPRCGGFLPWQSWKRFFSG